MEMSNIHCLVQYIMGRIIQCNIIYCLVYVLYNLLDHIFLNGLFVS